MKVLEVFGDDYGAVMYDNCVRDGKVDPLNLWEEASKNGHSVYEADDDYFEYLAWEFGEVDPKFITFIQDHIQDYDDSKHHNFYILD